MKMSGGLGNFEGNQGSFQVTRYPSSVVLKLHYWLNEHWLIGLQETTLR
jgi:hypothetical protein